MNRRTFLASSGAAAVTSPFLSAAEKPARFAFGIQQYTFRRPIQSGELDVLDYPMHCKNELGISNIEYWSGGLKKAQQPGYLAELKKRSVGEGLKNILILVDGIAKIDSPDAATRAASTEGHKPWVDIAAELSCESIRINVNAGGDEAQNLDNAAAGLPPLLDYAQKAGIRILLENHGGNSSKGDWVAALMKRVVHPSFGTLPDFGNFSGYDRYKGIEEMMPWAGTVCAKSHSFDDEGNEAKIDYMRMMKIVAASDYKGVISIEFEGGHTSPEAGAIATRELLKRAAEAAGESFA